VVAAFRGGGGGRAAAAFGGGGGRAAAAFAGEVGVEAAKPGPGGSASPEATPKLGGRRLGMAPLSMQLEETWTQLHDLHFGSAWHWAQQSRGR